jgi:hypothetical protein
MKKIAALLALVFMVVVAVAFVTAAEIPKDKEVITLERVKEKKPAPVFKHKEHADKLKDCTVCHHKTEKDQTPKPCFECHKKEADGDKVEFKKAMHNSCKDCHKKEKAAGKSAPTKCKECHVE